MKAVLQTGVGGYETLYIGEVPLPVPKEDEVLIKVEAFALNRADLAQREGILPPQKVSHHNPISNLLGLECSGYLVDSWGNIDKDLKVMAIVFGGAYAEYVAVKKENVIEVPENIDVIQAAAIPEAWVTAFQICKIANIHKGDQVLLHAAASGVGTALIQLIRLYDAESICIVSNDQKLTYCVNLGQGSAHGILRKDTSRLNKILNLTKYHGCTVILDCVGANEFDHNINSAAIDCRWISYGFLSGSKIGDFDLIKLMNKRINLHFTTLRNRSHEYKTELLIDFAKEIMPKFGTGELSPIIDTVYTDVNHIRDAHRKMEMDMNIGKIVVKW
jgi:tumor protein p53-inducible protein 3